MPWAILPTISVCGMYVKVILQSGFLVFHAATSMSTISLLPPDRSHIVRPPLLAHEVVAGEPCPAEGGWVAPWLQAATDRSVTARKTDHLRRVLIPSSSLSSGPGLPADGAGMPRAVTGHGHRTNRCIRLHTIVSRLKCRTL